jgi:uncharacterized protein YjbK
VRERELKLSLTAEEAERLQRHLGGPLRVLLQRNHYLDTPDERLRSRRIGLRLREETLLTDPPAPPRYLLTAKGPSRREEAIRDRPEIEVSLTAAAAGDILRAGIDPARSGLAPLRWAAREAAGARVAALGSIENLRRIYRLAPGAGQPPLELELDRTTYPDGSLEYELEVEYPPGEAHPPADADPLAGAIRDLLTSLDIPWRPSPAGKFRRFLERRRA